jgi:hypothetical protein
MTVRKAMAIGYCVAAPIGGAFIGYGRSSLLAAALIFALGCCVTLLALQRTST